MSERRAFNPVRAHKQAWQRQHVSQALRRVVQQTRGAAWPSVTPATPAPVARSTAPAMGSRRGE